MNITKLRNIAGDAVRVNRAYFTSSDQRSRILNTLRSDASDRRMGALIDEDIAASPAAAFPYSRLSANSLALTGIRVEAGGTSNLNVVIGEVQAQKVFAGIHTALGAAADLAKRLDIGLRVVMLDPTSPGNSSAKVAKFLEQALSIDKVQVVTRETVREPRYGSNDLWLATHSKTAHALQVAAETGVIEAHRVAYLIQDYEPGFSAWSTESALAQSTYAAGFLPIVNSSPLGDYLRRVEGLDLPDELVFSPRFELDKLREAAAGRERKERVRVLYYGRRSKHRNMFMLGVSALREAARELGPDAADVDFISAGEKHRNMPLASGAGLRSRGRIDWNAYFSFLSTVDVALSLQMSPHPSHPPFDAAISGALAVTNDFDGSRGGLHPRINAAKPTTHALASAVVEAVRASKNAEPREFLDVEPGVLGHDWSTVLESAASRIGKLVV